MLQIYFSDVIKKIKIRKPSPYIFVVTTENWSKVCETEGPAHSYSIQTIPRTDMSLYYRVAFFLYNKHTHLKSWYKERSHHLLLVCHKGITRGHQARLGINDSKSQYGKPTFSWAIKIHEIHEEIVIAKTS